MLPFARMRNHYYGIALSSAAAVVFFYIVTYVGWDFGDHVTGDVAQSGFQFSNLERRFQISDFRFQIADRGSRIADCGKIALTRPSE